MNVSSTQFRLIRKEKDPKFNIDHLEHYNLLLQAGFSDMQLCITDTRKNRILLLEDYVMPGVSSQNDRIDCLDSLFDDHHLLLAGFWKKVKIIVKNKKFSLVPQDLFLHENIQEYIEVNSSILPSEEICLFNTNDDLSLVNAFVVHKGVREFIEKTYQSKDIEYYHQSSSFVNGLTRHFAEDPGKNICLYLDRFVLHIAVIINSKFIFYNQFPVKTFEDYIRYAGYVVDELEIDIRNDKFHVWGYLGRNSKHFDKLKKSFPNLKFGDRPKGLKMGYVFDSIPDHQYFDLLSFNFLS